MKLFVISMIMMILASSCGYTEQTPTETKDVITENDSTLFFICDPNIPVDSVIGIEDYYE